MNAPAKIGLGLAGLLVLVLIVMPADDTDAEAFSTIPAVNCLTPTQAFRDKLGVEGLGELRAVRSPDHEHAYYIAGEVDLGTTTVVGIWFSNRINGEAGMLFSAESATESISGWGDGSRTQANTGPHDRAYGQAQRCLREALR